MDVIYIGTAIIDSIIKGFDPNPISTTGYNANSSTLNIGGEAINGIISANKLGLDTTILCHLGNDIAGNIIKEELIKYNIDISNIIFSDNPTPITNMFVNEDGTRKSITNNAHKYNFHPEKYLDKINGKAIVLGSLFRPPFDDKEVIHKVLKYAKDNNMIVFCDTKLPNNNILSLDDIKESLPFIDYITPNLDEAKYYTNENDISKMADIFLNYGIKNVIIKLGGEGCYFKSDKEEIQLPAYKIDAKDATGAGDNFLAGFLYKTLNGASNKDALIFANACGAICTSEVGGTTALKDNEQVLKFIETMEKNK